VTAGRLGSAALEKCSLPENGDFLKMLNVND
jgi:hypothetical protein